jgi:dolichol kinase
MQEALNAVLLAVGYLVLFACAEALYRIARVPVEWSRKFIHIAGGSLSLFMPVLFQHSYMVLLLAVSFMALLWISRRLGYLDSVHAVERTSYGSILFPIPIFLCFIWQEYYGEPLLFYLPVSVLTLADPLAYLVGSRLPWIPYSVGPSRKTVSGSLAFAIATMLLLVVFLSPHLAQGLPVMAVCIGISLVAALAEGLSPYGWDNLTVPLVVAACIHYLI